MNGYGEKRLARINTLRAELSDWAEGRQSHLNEFMSVESSPENRQQTLVATAQADAAEVQKLSARIQAECSIAESLGWSR